MNNVQNLIKKSSVYVYRTFFALRGVKKIRGGGMRNRPKILPRLNHGYWLNRVSLCYHKTTDTVKPWLGPNNMIY
jgi:hypothetical protein